MEKLAILVIFAILNVQVRGKIYSNCELLDELFEKFNSTVVDAEELLCIAKTTGLDSRYSGSDGTFGIFKIGQSMADACSVSSTHQLMDDDISDDYNCALKGLTSNSFDPITESEDCFEIVDNCYKLADNITEGELDVEGQNVSNETLTTRIDDKTEELSIKPIYSIEPLLNIPRKPPVDEIPRASKEHLAKLSLINEFAEKNRDQKVNIFFVFV